MNDSTVMIAECLLDLVMMCGAFLRLDAIERMKLYCRIGVTIQVDVLPSKSQALCQLIL